MIGVGRRVAGGREGCFVSMTIIVGANVGLVGEGEGFWEGDFVGSVG